MAGISWIVPSLPAGAQTATPPAPVVVPDQASVAPAPRPAVPVPVAPAAAPAPAAVPAPAAITTTALLPPPATPAAPVIAPAPSPEGASPAPAAEAPALVKPKKRIVHVAEPRETALSTDPTPTLTPETFFATAKASERYSAIADAGGWPQIPAVLSPRSKGHPVATLRLRLAIEGDLTAPGQDAGGVQPSQPASMFDTRWTPDLTEAVKRFQERHGLKQTGIVAGATLKAMNVTARTRFIELASSAQRLAGRNFDFADKRIVVNLPSASAEAIENGQVVRRYTTIVGAPGHESPEVDAKAIAVNFNPTWTLPQSIIKNEIMPKMQRDPGYLARERMKVLDGSGKPIPMSSINWHSDKVLNYIIRQDSGRGNALGQLRINMPNKYAVYMHDTPTKNLFGGDERFLSHGCVRVQGVNDLALWLLQDAGGAPDGTWSKQDIDAKLDAGQHEEVKLNHAVPVAWVYLTGWANGDGVAQFRDDVYGLDTVGAPNETPPNLDTVSQNTAPQNTAPQN